MGLVPVLLHDLSECSAFFTGNTTGKSLGQRIKNYYYFNFNYNCYDIIIFNFI
jgi:hypothetical protein